MANFFSRWHARRYSRSNRATWTAVDSPGKSMASDAAAGSSPDTVPVAVQPSWRGTTLGTSATIVSVQVGPLRRNDWSAIGEDHLGQDEINGVGQTDDSRRHRHAIHLLRQQPVRFAPVAVLCARNQTTGDTRSIRSSGVLGDGRARGRCRFGGGESARVGAGSCDGGGGGGAGLTSNVDDARAVQRNGLNANCDMWTCALMLNCGLQSRSACGDPRPGTRPPPSDAALACTGR